MATGIDLNTSRRTYHTKCRYWKVNTKYKDKSELVHDKKPFGIFFAKENNSWTSDNEIVNEVLMIKTSEISISTQDKNSLEVNDIVDYNGDLWIVINVQRKKIKRQSQFMKTTSEITYIQLRS